MVGLGFNTYSTVMKTNLLYSLSMSSHLLMKCNVTLHHTKLICHSILKCSLFTLCIINNYDIRWQCSTENHGALMHPPATRPLIIISCPTVLKRRHCSGPYGNSSKIFWVCMSNGSAERGLTDRHTYRQTGLILYPRPLTSEGISLWTEDCCLPYTKIYDVPMKFANKLIHGGPVHHCHEPLEVVHLLEHWRNKK